MTIDLQDEEGAYERSLMTIRDQFGLEALAFFAPEKDADDPLPGLAETVGYTKGLLAAMAV
jgi:hypothetical protein